MSPIPEPDERRALAVGREKLRAQPSERAASATAAAPADEW